MKELMLNMSKEFDQKKGLVTCEFSLHKSKVALFNDIAKDIRMIYGKWHLEACESCILHNGEGYLHASIQKK